MNPADAVPFVLLVLFVGAFIGGVVFIAFAARWHRLALQTSKPLSSDFVSFTPRVTIPKIDDSIRPRPRLWLAIHNPDAAGVFATLGLGNPQPSHWSECFSGSGKMFVSVPVNGWTLVVGDGIPDPADDVDRCFRFLLNLSTALGHVQLYLADGLLNQHAWARLESGRVIRAYAWAGQTIWNQGGVTAEERLLEMKCRGYGDDTDPADWRWRDCFVENVEKIPSLAAHWSFDPAELEAVPSAQTAGLAGFSGWIAS